MVARDVVLVALALLFVLSWWSRGVALATTSVHPSLHGAVGRSTTACYVINLQKRAERVNDFLKHYHRSDLHDTLGLPVQVVPAFDGRKLDVQSLVTPKAWREIQATERNGRRQGHSQLTRGAVGCYMSHLDCLRRFLATDKQYALIFEDDAVLMFRIGHAIQHTMDTARTGWDVLLLGYWCTACTAGSAAAWWGLQGYMVTREGARKVLDGCALPFELQLDHKMSQMATAGRLRVGRAASNLVPQASDVYRTDIQTPVHTG